MIKKLVIGILLILVVFVGIIFYSKNNKRDLNGKKLNVVTSFYPYYFFASQIGGEKINVINITPAGAEPHDYEPTPGDIINIERSKILVMNGSVEPWAGKIKDELKNRNVLVLEMDKGLFSQKVLNENGITATDPHIWLSLKLDLIQINLIANTFGQIDPTNKAYYNQNANILISKIKSLDNSYKNGLSMCQLKDIVTSHAAFGYMASDYNLKQISIAGLSPDAEPSLKELSELTNFVRSNHIQYVFFESLVSPKLSETLASETQAKTLVLNPLEGLTNDDLAKGRDFITVMQDNLTNLKIALQCK